MLKTAGTRQLWQFTPEREHFRLEREYAPAAEDTLPAKVIAQTWSSLWQKKLNVGWLPPGSVFLQVAHFPASETSELISMVEFQLEKLSPLPTNQIVWSMELLPTTADGQQTVVVLIAARDQVENYLGQLEGQSFVADQLEVPMLDQMLATEIKGDGVWVYAPQEGVNTAWLAAWWYGGCLRHLGLIQLPEGSDCEKALKEQLQQMAWAGELDGWLTAPPRWHLVADTVHASMFGSVFRELSGEEPLVITPHPAAQVAALTAKRLAQPNRPPGLLPPEVADRYRASFVDRLWLSGIISVIMVYLFLTLIYFGWLEVLKLQSTQAEGRVASLSSTYTNALQLKAQIQILQDQQSFKYAALECWEATARNLPEGLTLTGLSMNRERSLMLFGTASQDLSSKVTDFNSAMKKTDLNGQPLFTTVKAPTMNGMSGQIKWSFDCTLNRLEKE
ncbi:MAG: hypothetical protein WCO56_25795 [Verrucomicrobiota bacterium]